MHFFAGWLHVFSNVYLPGMLYGLFRGDPPRFGLTLSQPTRPFAREPSESPRFFVKPEIIPKSQRIRRNYHERI